jgi:hypothetical protein
MKFYVTERIGPKQSLTPEGFLLCEEVPIARIGIMDYHESELPLEALNGVIRVQRLEEEVFAPAAMASFAGKPLVNGHPDDDVTPLTWRELAIGTVLNPRRGEGNLSDVVLADFLITDAEGIKAVQGGKVQVSCGYEAEYEQIKPGLAKQYGIVGNHVALEEAGRCGPRCSIGDQAISITLKEGQMAKLTTKKSFKDRLMAAFKAKDEAAIEKLAGEVTEDAEEPIAESDIKAGSGITINVHGTGAAAPAAEAKTGDEDADKDKDDPMKPVMDAIGALGERLTKLEGAGSATADADGDDGDDDDTSTTDAESDEDVDKDKGKDKTKDGKGKTRDSAGLATSFQDTIARAEILSPGVKVPTFDAKMERKKTRDALCAFRRKVLDKAYATDEGKAAIDPLLAGRTLVTSKLTCDAASILFTAASENMKAVNRAATSSSGKIRANDTGAVKVPSIAEINKLNADAWKPKV